MIHSTFADRLRTAREGRGWSQAELARRARLGQAAVQRIEAGKRAPRPDTIARLADALEVPPAALLGPALGAPGPWAAALAALERRLAPDDQRRILDLARRLAQPGPESPDPIV